MNIDKERLKKLAQAAQNDSGDYAALNDYGMAVPPAVTLALLAEIERLEVDNSSMRGSTKRMGEDASRAQKQERKRQREIAQLKAENDTLKAAAMGIRDVWREDQAENEALREGMKGDYDLDAWLDWVKNAEALRKDAERYQWLCTQFGVTKLPCAIERILGGEAYVADGKASIDAAIDAALAEEVQP
ncbi:MULTISPECIES: hypothetical protein [unclassified Pseudomonas]|uniref:hypothetical protein n=1 Tax=unclassified Pseudomonas TaxID=196821 RepID=UPI000A1EB497|nr:MULTISPECIES: hypothetical protein [unclassified Pseudomonas]